MTRKTRMFNGHRFKLYGTLHGKTAADGAKELKKKQGYKVRTVGHYQGKYKLYIHK